MKVGVPVCGSSLCDGGLRVLLWLCLLNLRGSFTAEAKSFAEGRNIELVDGGKLKLLLADRNPTKLCR